MEGFSRRGALVSFWTGYLGLASGCQLSHYSRVSITLNVFVSGGFTPACRALIPAYEKAASAGIMLSGGPSMGSTPNAIPARLDRREPADVVILAREALDRLAASGQVDPASITDLASSRIAVAVRAGAAVPDIATVADLRKALLAAKSVAYSDSASGVYLSETLFPQLGIATEMAMKARKIPATPVGEIVARGEAELGFQQLSELKPVSGIKIIGLIPEEIQKVTMFSAGIVSYSKQAREGAGFIAFLASPRSASTIRESGMAPVTDRQAMAEFERAIT